MDKNNLKDAYDIGENMAVFSGEGRSYTIINKETGKTRQLVSEDGIPEIFFASDNNGRGITYVIIVDKCRRIERIPSGCPL